MRRRLAGLVWILAGALLLLFLLKAHVADVYRVDSPSMRPTIYGGVDPRGGAALDERVLVRYGALDAFARFDLVVFRGADGEAVVKRVGALPGEAVQVDHGDLLVNGRMLPGEEQRPPPIVLFDDARLRVRDAFHFMEAPDGPWAETGDHWTLDAHEIALGGELGMLLLHDDLHDGYLDASDEVVRGHSQVNDGIVECELRVDDASGRVRLRLVEEGDTFEAVVEHVEDGRFRALIVRTNAETQATGTAAERQHVLAYADVPLELGHWHRAHFSNIDDHLRFEFDDVVLDASYAGNLPHPRHEIAVARRSVGARAALGGENCRAAFRRIRVLRDLYWKTRGEYAAAEALSLGPGELFVLGDNSSHSRDSRDFGPVRIEDVLGRPTRVLWPLSRIRPLEPEPSSP